MNTSRRSCLASSFEAFGIFEVIGGGKKNSAVGSLIESCSELHIGA